MTTKINYLSLLRGSTNSPGVYLTLCCCSLYVNLRAFNSNLCHAKSVTRMRARALPSFISSPVSYFKLFCVCQQNI